MKRNKTNATIFIFFYLFLSAWALMAIGGCNGHIPPASIVRSGKITIAWNEVPNATAYNIYFSTSPGVTKFNAYKIQNATNPITITDLEPGTTYYFIITVINEFGESEESKEIFHSVADSEGFIKFDELAIKSAPQKNALEPEKRPETSATSQKISDKKTEPNAMALSILDQTVLDEKPGINKVTLTWDKVPNAKKYNVYWSNSPGVTKHNGIKISTVDNTVTISGLKNGTTYYFVVTAVNDSGESKESAELHHTVGE